MSTKVTMSIYWDVLRVLYKMHVSKTVKFESKKDMADLIKKQTPKSVIDYFYGLSSPIEKIKLEKKEIKMIESKIEPLHYLPTNVMLFEKKFILTPNGLKEQKENFDFVYYYMRKKNKELKRMIDNSAVLDTYGFAQYSVKNVLVTLCELINSLTDVDFSISYWLRDLNDLEINLGTSEADFRNSYLNDISKRSVVSEESNVIIISAKDKLSTFSAFDVEYEGVIYKTAEHAYQAAKFPKDSESYQAVVKADTAAKAYKIGNDDSRATISDWDNIKKDVMTAILRNKLERHEPVMQALKATGTKTLVRHPRKKDVYWGMYNGVGQNVYGNILMSLRDE